MNFVVEEGVYAQPKVFFFFHVAHCAQMYSIRTREMNGSILLSKQHLGFSRRTAKDSSSPNHHFIPNGLNTCGSSVVVGTRSVLDVFFFVCVCVCCIFEILAYT